jgi:hypothetical protein
MASLNGTTPQNTYPSLIKFNDNNAISASLRLLSDGAGGATPLYLSASQINIGGTGLINSTLGIKGSGATSATTSLLVQNSSGAEAFKITDDAKTTINNLAASTLAVSGISSFTGTIYIYAPIVDDSNLQRIYWNANELDFFTNGSSSMRITKATKNVLIGTTTDIASSKLTVNSTTQGALLPRMTTTQVNAIATPAAGLIVYNTTLNVLCCYDGTSWYRVSMAIPM